MSEPSIEVSQWCREQVGAENVALLGAFAYSMRQRGILAAKTSEIVDAFELFKRGN